MRALAKRREVSKDFAALDISSEMLSMQNHRFDMQKIAIVILHPVYESSKLNKKSKPFLTLIRNINLSVSITFSVVNFPVNELLLHLVVAY